MLQCLKQSAINGQTFKENRNLMYGKNNDVPECVGTERKFVRVCACKKFEVGYSMEDYEKFLSQLDYSWIISVDWNSDLSECAILYVKEVEV